MAIDKKMLWFSKWRRRLYRLSFALFVMAGAMTAPYGRWFDRDAIEPLLRWLRELYPDLLAGFIVATLAIWGIRSVLDRKEREHARSLWAGIAPWTEWARGPAVRPVHLLVALALAGLFGGMALYGGWEEWSEKQICCSDEVVQTSGCADVRGLCRLGSGEAVRVTMRADKARNPTGVFLEAGAWYTARHVSSQGWRDKNLHVGPTGFRFCKRKSGLSRFWWAEWLLPHPDGAWFQVLGRIDREKRPFPILDPCNAAQPRAFVAPQDGELVLLVNDLIFSNNRGVMTLEVGRSARGYEASFEAKARGIGDCRAPFEHGREGC